MFVFLSKRAFVCKQQIYFATIRCLLNIIYTSPPSVTLMYYNYSCDCYSSLYTTGNLIVLHIFSLHKALLETLKRQRIVAKYICLFNKYSFGKKNKHKQSRRESITMFYKNPLSAPFLFSLEDPSKVMCTHIL